MKLFLDDIRNPVGKLNPIYNEEWIIAKNYNEFKELINNHSKEITHISFDHDLADEHYDMSMYDDKGLYNEKYDTFQEKTGYDCAKYMKWFYDKFHMKYPIMFVHSMNPTGTENIINLFK
jgi:hypothetical protein